MALTNIQIIFFVAILPCLLSSILVYFIIIFSKNHNLYDEVGGRKIHSGQIPRLGGIGFVLAFMFSCVAIYFSFPGLLVISNKFLLLIIASIIIFLMGLIDDLKNLKALYKLIIQLIVATIVVFAGYHFTKISFAPIGLFLSLGIFSYPITILWIAGVINAVNLMDGIDGQVGCLSISLLISYAVLFYYNDSVSNLKLVYLCIILIFSILGFLFFNLSYPHAKIFMGDSGSQFLGFALSLLPLIPKTDGYETATIPFAILFLMLPIFDMIATIVRRIRDKKQIRAGDKLHMHHKLMLIGFSQRGALLTFMILQIITSIFVSLAVLLQGIMALTTVIGLVLVGILFFMLIHFEKENHLKQNENLEK
ncbi:MAG: glycosyltransferase family 4 protein [Treponema sp.]